MYYFYPNYDIIKKLIKIKTLQIISLHSNFTTFATLIPFILISFAYSLRSFRSFAALIRSIHSARMLPSLCSGSIRSGRWEEEEDLEGEIQRRRVCLGNECRERRECSEWNERWVQRKKLVTIHFWNMI